MAWGASGGIGLGTEDSAAVLTVLFTDIAGSTVLTERLGDERWVEVLSSHDAAVRRALATHGGLEIKTVGDGFMAVFSGAAAAVRAGVDVHRLVSGVHVPEVPGGLRIRVGVHSGPVICRAGDVLGRTVHVARRIASAADCGQVLVSAAVRVLAEQAEGFRAGTPRTIRLRGVAEPQVVVAMDVVGDGAVATVHPLAAAGAR